MSVYQKINQAVQVIEARCRESWEEYRPPQVGVILGSGLGDVADHCENKVVIPYSEIPSFHGTSVEGHAGQMLLGTFEGTPAVFLKGRFHRYEGYSMDEVVFPTRTICGLGINTLVLTNAAGGVNPDFQPTDLMIIEDHINLMGDNPLKGPNIRELGPRFPDLTEAYNRQCIDLLKNSGQDLKLPIRQGVYVGLLGPTYETPAEVRMLRTVGGDAVGMSTVPESIAANHLGVRVCGISCITNLAAGIAQQKLTHEEVIENSRKGAEYMSQLLKAAIPQLAATKITGKNP